MVEAGELNSTILSEKRRIVEGRRPLPTRTGRRGLEKFISSAAKDAGLAIEDAALEVLQKNSAATASPSAASSKSSSSTRRKQTVTLTDVKAIVGDTTGSETDR